MRRIIHHIRKQPEAVRRQILHILVLMSAVILILLWIYSLGTTLANPDNQTKVSQDLKPFSTFKDNMIGGYNSITGQQ